MSLSLCPPARYSYPGIFMKNIYPNYKQATQNMHKIIQSCFNFLMSGQIEKMIDKTPSSIFPPPESICGEKK